MEQEELISKKELLQLTGISYGQLYRWKRQQLIPEAWFLKQSSFTGQETFFPRYKILARISVILDLKDQYSLEELALLFAPENANRLYSLKAVQKLLGLSVSLMAVCEEVWKKDSFNFMELLFLYLGNELEQKIGLTKVNLQEWLQTSEDWVVQLGNRKNTSIIDQRIFIIRKGDTTLFFMLDGKGKVFPDSQSKVIYTFDLAERSNEMNMTIQHMAGG